MEIHIPDSVTVPAPGATSTYPTQHNATVPLDEHFSEDKGLRGIGDGQ